MHIAYLGLFQKIFNWVLDKIFAPVFDWLTDLISEVFTWVFDEILSPILLPILEAVMEFAIDLFMKIFGLRFYMIFSGLLQLIDYIEEAFNVFIGLTDVTYTQVGGDTTTGPLLDVLLGQETVSRVFWLLTCGGLAIALGLTIYATAKSAFDLDFENKRPVSKVLTAMMKTFIQFFSVPFFVYFMLRLATTILTVISSQLTGGQATSLGRVLFVVASLDAAIR